MGRPHSNNVQHRLWFYYFLDLDVAISSGVSEMTVDHLLLFSGDCVRHQIDPAAGLQPHGRTDHVFPVAAIGVAGHVFQFENCLIPVEVGHEIAASLVRKQYLVARLTDYALLSLEVYSKIRLAEVYYLQHPTLDCELTLIFCPVAHLQMVFLALSGKAH